MIADRPDLLDAPPVLGGRVVRAAEPIDVEVTARWADGVVETHHGVATHWCGDSVHVIWHGGRFGGQTNAWMPASAVRRL